MILLVNLITISLAYDNLALNWLLMLNKGWRCMGLYIDGDYKWRVIINCPGKRGNIEQYYSTKICG